MGKTSDPRIAYSWAINAVRKEMKELGFSERFRDVPGRHTIVSFINSQEEYGIELHYQDDHSDLTASEPFVFFPLSPHSNMKANNTWRELSKISLPNNEVDEEEVRAFIEMRIKKLFCDPTKHGQ